MEISAGQKRSHPAPMGFRLLDYALRPNCRQCGHSKMRPQKLLGDFTSNWKCVAWPFPSQRPWGILAVVFTENPAIIALYPPTLSEARLLAKTHSAPMPSYVVTIRREMDICSDAIKTVLRCERCEWMRSIYHTADTATAQGNTSPKRLPSSVATYTTIQRKQAC